ncbi:hypothetical protein PVL29_001806 [Vitis rotundifolia]|uniref:Mitochondrial substrate carrier family protein n=1 Tax=Vitis rotundifolia TaxID=103349 RepID=A0AA39AF71_VITRO|nr:hypothetical protein PVL29_001806 [Vitis rotundifolia]
MGFCSKQPKRDQPSTNYRYKSLKQASFEFVHEDYGGTLPDNDNRRAKVTESKSCEILSTTELISAVGQIWDCASRPLSIFQPKANSKHSDTDSKKEKVLCYLGGEGYVGVPTSANSKYFCIDLKTASLFSPMVQPNIEHLNITQKMSLFEPGNGNYAHSFFLRCLCGGTNMPNETWKEMGLTNVGISYDLGNIYRWMSKITLDTLRSPVDITQIENKKIKECCISKDATNTAGCGLNIDVAIPANHPATESADRYTDFTKGNGANERVMNTRVSISSLCTDYFLGADHGIAAGGSISRTPSSELHADSNFLSSTDFAFEECQHKTEDVDRQKEFVTKDKLKMETCPSKQDKHHYALAKQEHAFAGAFAGVFVSLCLHPVDTIKTVIQSCQADQKSIFSVGRLIISQRGLAGFYRGITSNIASSAPISAVYTFTYESVKGALLPLFPKECHSIAHCMAGGCASIATSFIFTPSERIKQQMQIGSHYQNCWNALVGIIKKGGLPSLYAGWGAVLCRNVPHSIIKFYTYESLKQLMLPSLQPNAKPNTLQTVCVFSSPLPFHI